MGLGPRPLPPPPPGEGAPGWCLGSQKGGGGGLVRKVQTSVFSLNNNNPKFQSCFFFTSGPFIMIKYHL